MEVLYMCTGEYVKHPGTEAFRVLFVDDHNRCRSQMAEAIASSMNQPRFIFSSAGIEPQPVDPLTIEFMRKKDFDLSRVVPKAMHQIPNLEHYQVIVALSPNVLKIFPQRPRKTIFLDWSVESSSEKQGAGADPCAPYEETFAFIRSHVTDLVNAIIGMEKE
jgi:protein-tyrosine-phosphatase